MGNPTDGNHKINYNRLLLIATALLIPLNTAFSGLIKAPWLMTLLGVVGCSCLPLWALLIDEGAKYEKNQTLYSLKVLGLAIISAYPFFLCYGDKTFSAQLFFSLGITAFVYLGFTQLYDKLKKASLKLVAIVTIVIVMFVLIRSDWFLCLIPAFAVHLYKNNFGKLSYYLVSFSLVFLVIGIFSYFRAGDSTQLSKISESYHMISLAGCSLSLPLLKMYDDVSVKKIRYIPYIAYPFILLVLFAIKGFLA